MCMHVAQALSLRMVVCTENRYFLSPLLYHYCFKFGYSHIYLLRAAFSLYR